MRRVGSSWLKTSSNFGVGPNRYASRSADLCHRLPVLHSLGADDAPPFSLINPRSKNVIGKLEILAKQVDGVVYDPDEKRYLISVGPTSEHRHGSVVAIDPVRRAIVARSPPTEDDDEGCFSPGQRIARSNGSARLRPPVSDPKPVSSSASRRRFCGG